jgi:hypothetical protein
MTGRKVRVRVEVWVDAKMVRHVDKKAGDGKMVFETTAPFKWELPAGTQLDVGLGDYTGLYVEAGETKLLNCVVRPLAMEDENG